LHCCFRSMSFWKKHTESVYTVTRLFIPWIMLEALKGIWQALDQKNPCELVEQLYKGLASLPEKQHNRIYAFYFLGMSKSVIARAEKINESNVRQSIEHGLRNLEKILKKISKPDGEIALKMYGIVRRAFPAGQPWVRHQGTGSGPPQGVTHICSAICGTLTISYTLLWVLHSVFRAEDGAAQRQTAWRSDE
jgi:predicted DNA-binding protein YlxM (UPF0122 family)